MLTLILAAILLVILMCNRTARAFVGACVLGACVLGCLFGAWVVFSTTVLPFLTH